MSSEECIIEEANLARTLLTGLLLRMHRPGAGHMLIPQLQEKLGN